MLRFDICDDELTNSNPPRRFMSLVFVNSL